MRTARVRITVRQLMIAVALAACLMATVVGLHRRAAHLRRLSFLQSREADRWERPLTETSVNDQLASAILDKVHWHDAMAARYERAAQAPWLPVEGPASAPPTPELPDELSSKYRLSGSAAPPP
jgi:hypothetical protein